MVACHPSHRLLELLRGNAPTLVLTGAGISAESGLATFRGPEGLWENHDPTELATRAAFEKDPLTVWRFYAWRRERASSASPNRGHRALAALDTAARDFTLVTQNVDGLHERAGTSRVIRLHGSLFTLRCTAEGTETEDSRSLGTLPPRCRCGALLRPGVVWFGETLPARALERALEAARRARLVLVVGTSALVQPAASIPLLAIEAGAYAVEINPAQTPLSPLVQERFAATSAHALPEILEAAGLPALGAA